MDITLKRFWPWFFFAAAFESLVAIILLLAVPSEAGISLARAGVLGILLAFTASGLFLGVVAKRVSLKFDQLPLQVFIPTSAILALISGLLLFLLRYLQPERLLPYYSRLAPLFWFLLILGVQALVFFLFLEYGFHPQVWAEQAAILRAGIPAFVVFLFLFGFVSVTRIGIRPDTGYWGEPGVAVQGWQAILAILAGFGVMLLSMGKARRESPPFRWMLPIAIYATACVLWLGVPVGVLAESFYSPITPPANVPFPYSDAGFYDYTAQSLLIGTDYLGGIPPRPLYVLFLAVLHGVFGQDYPAMIAAQTMVLALFPVALYFLGARLHSPAAGTVAALLAVFRELVGLWVSSSTRVVNSKIFTTDLPTALGIAVLCLIVIWWFERQDLRSSLIAGGSFGLLLLLRTQSLFTLPFILLAALFAFQRNVKRWVVAGLIFTIAFVLTVLPWLIHNYTLTGRFTFDDPRQMAIIYSQYSFSGNLDLSQFDPQKDSLGDRLVGFALENPGYVANFILTHFLNTEIGGLLALPLIKPFPGLLEPINLYWMEWDGTLEWYNVLLVLFYLGMLALGLGVAWHRTRWMGMAPLVFNLGYALANGISRFSSWRYNLPVDWVIYFYSAIGVGEVLALILSLVGARYLLQPEKKPQRRLRNGEIQPVLIIVVLFFAIVGSLPVMAKGVVQPRYTSTLSELISRLEAAGIPHADITAFLANPGSLLEEGMVLYPRMYRRDLGMSSANPWPAYAIREYPRLGFLLLDDHQTQAVFRTRDLLEVPHAADAVMLGCVGDGFVDVRLLFLEGRIFQSAPLTDPCE